MVTWKYQNYGCSILMHDIAFFLIQWKLTVLGVLNSFSTVSKEKFYNLYVSLSRSIIAASLLSLFLLLWNFWWFIWFKCDMISIKVNFLLLFTILTDIFFSLIYRYRRGSNSLLKLFDLGKPMLWVFLVSMIIIG